MTFALTRFAAYGVEIAEPLQKRFIQRCEMDITGANTNVAYDLGAITAGALGTFWTAVSGTDPGTTALKAWRDIALVAKTYRNVGGLGLTGKSAVSSTGGGLTYYDSATSTGGAATEALTVTGLLAVDTILAVSQQTKGGNSTALNGWTDAGRTDNTVTASWTGNPGSGSIVRFAVRKAAAALTPVAGQYSVTLDTTTTTLPNILFASGDAPTTAYLVYEWEMKDGELPIYVSKSA